MGLESSLRSRCGISKYTSCRIRKVCTPFGVTLSEDVALRAADLGIAGQNTDQLKYLEEAAKP